MRTIPGESKDLKIQDVSKMNDVAQFMKNVEVMLEPGARHDY